MFRLKNRLTEFLALVVVSLATLLVGWQAAMFIPVIDSGKSFVPQSVDYLRTFVLAGCSSFIVNYLYKLVDKTFIFVKVWIEFLALLLLAYPQKTERQYTYSSWNLVKREGFLFGLFYTMVYLGFYIFDLWKLEADEKELNKFARGDDIEANINEEVRRKSTLSNCINIRRNSSNLKKVIYSTEYYPGQRIDELEPTETESLLKKPDMIVVDYSRDSMDFMSQSQSTSGRADRSLIAEENSPMYGSVITSVISRGSALDGERSIDMRWIMENSLWIVLTMLHEVGLSLLLSVTFIYVPELDDSLFTLPEIYFYNKINLFCMVVVAPLFLISSFVQILLHAVAEEPEKRTRTFGVYSGVSLALFLAGIACT